MYLGVWSPDSASAVWHLVGTPGTWQRCYAAPCMTMLQRHSCPCPSPSAAGLPKVSAASLVKGVVSKSACAPSKLKGPSLGPFEGQKCLPCLLCATVYCSRLCYLLPTPASLPTFPQDPSLLDAVVGGAPLSKLQMRNKSQAPVSRAVPNLKGISA